MSCSLLCLFCSAAAPSQRTRQPITYTYAMLSPRGILILLLLSWTALSLTAQTPLDGQTFIIQSAAPGSQNRVLDADGHTLGRTGTTVHLWANDLAHNNVNQKWQFVSAGRGPNVYRILSLSPWAGRFRYLDADGSTLQRDGGNLQLWDDNNGQGITNQMWRVERKPNGNYRIVSAISAAGGRVLDADGRTQGRDGAKVQLWSSLANNPNQEWRLLPTAPAFLTEAGNAERRSFYDAYGGRDKFSSDYQFVLEATLAAKESIQRGDFPTADRTLRAVWQHLPLNSQRWTDLTNEGNRLTVNAGSPPLYAALRMLTDVVRVHRETAGRTPTETVNVSVVLIGKSNGKIPASKQEVIAGEGRDVKNLLMDRIRSNDYSVVRKSLDVFNQYVYALTEGRAAVKLDFIELPDYSLPLSYHHSVNEQGNDVYRVAGDWPATANQLSDAQRKKTDLYIVIYPSLIRDNLPFTVSATGGQTSANWTPLIVFDDKFMLNPAGVHDLAVQLYMPQFYQHELFHWLFSLYPQLGLERTSHQWFDPNKWPEGLSKVATREPDYYHETLFKKMRSQTPSIFQHLTSRNPYLSGDVDMNSLLGSYVTDQQLDYGGQKIQFKADLTRKDGKYYWTYRQPAGAAVFEIAKSSAAGLVDIVASNVNWAATGPAFRVLPANNPVTGQDAALNLRGLIFRKE